MSWNLPSAGFDKQLEITDMRPVVLKKGGGVTLFLVTCDNLASMHAPDEMRNTTPLIDLAGVSKGTIGQKYSLVWY